MCAIFCREAGLGACPSYYFNATESTCTFGDVEGDLILVPHGQGVKAMSDVAAEEHAVDRSEIIKSNIHYWFLALGYFVSRTFSCNFPWSPWSRMSHYSSQVDP